MKKLRNEVAYAVACCCEKCRTKSGRDFEILGSLHSSMREAREDLGAYRTSRHFPVFVVRETLEPVQIPQRKPKARKAA